MSNALATRDGHAPATAAPASLAIQPGQLTWDKFQEAALNQIGLRNASNADKAVFLHQCQRTGLDPFAKQIMMIERKVWTRPEPPAAIEVTYTVRDRNGVETPYTSVLRFAEYLQTKNDKDGRPYAIAQWKDKPVHMLEKCTEADVYRKTFPQDYAGIDLADAMPEPDYDAPPAQAPRQRVTADQARQRTHAVTATVVTPEPSPAAPDAPVSGPAATPAEVAAAGEAQHLKTGPQYIAERLEKLGVTGVVRTAARLAGRQLADLDELTDAEAVAVMRTLSTCKTAADLDGVLADLELASDSREDGDGGE